MLWFIILILASWLIVDPLGEWLAGWSDSVWWALLPWVLIVLFWTIIIRQLLRRRQHP